MFGNVFTYRRVVFLCLMVAGGYLLRGPLLAFLDGNWFSSKQGEIAQTLRLGITPRVVMAADQKKVVSIPQGNMLSIPEIGINTPLLEGDSLKVLKQGIWHRPGTGDPINGGNMVLAGHRYKWTEGPHTFYHLPELKTGSEITIFWKQHRYVYVVKSVYTVAASATDIESQKDGDDLTLFTCTLLDAEDRVVIKAILKK